MRGLLAFGIKMQMVGFEVAPYVIESVIDRIRKLQELVLACADHAGAHHVLPIEYLVPIFASVNQDQVVRGKLVGLQQREHLPQLVHGAEAAGKDDERFGHLREPKFAHEEIVKIEV